MAKPKRQSKIPQFRNEAEEARFWDTHDSTDYLSELTPVRVKFTKPRRLPVSINLTGFEVRILRGILARLTHSRPHATAHPKR